MKYCSHCVTPANHPYVRIGEDGVCSACRAYERRRQIDWARREEEFKEVAERARERAEGYDCLIPVSGGKDSFWQVVTCLEYGLTPLAVTWRDPARLPLGQENLDRLIRIGVDHIDFSINPEVERRFLRKSFEKHGVPGIPKHMALYNLPLRAAVQYRIPLIVWGENPAIEYGVIENGGRGFEVDQEWLNQNHGVTQGTTAEDWIDDDLTRKELTPYFPPPAEEVAAQRIGAVYLGYYFPWDPQKNFELARRHGFRAPEKGPGYHVYDDVDSGFISIHHFLKWYKFGYTRLFDNLSIEIRAGRMTRDEAIEVIRQRAPETPYDDIRAFCGFLGITPGYFWRVTETLRNSEIWRRRGGRWVVDDFIVPDWQGWEVAGGETGHRAADLRDGVPERTPYVSTGRYQKPKEDFRTIMARMEDVLDVKACHRVVDVGCANGELLYHLYRRYPHWQFTGFDRNARFLDTGRAFPGLSGVDLRQADLFEIEGEYDIVIATCFLSLFPDIEPPLDKLLSLCRPGGYVFATGLFNPFDIEVRVQFSDDSHPETRGRWRTDFNRHSQRRIREHVDSRVQSVEFEACTYDIEIEPDSENPVRVWTRRDAEGRTWLVNGAWQIANQILMSIHK